MHVPEPGWITGRIAAAALMAAVSACSPGGQGDRVEPTSPPQSGEILYHSVYEEFCSEVRWSRISSRLGITIGDIRSDHYGPHWQVLCDMEEIDADFLDDERARWNTATLKLVLFSKPGDAYTYYSSVVGRETARQEFAISEVAGWWGEGRSLERVWSDRGRNGAVIYNIYHENLVLIFTLAVQGLDATDAVGPLHDVARAVLEEVKLQLPCRSLVDPPVAGCDPQSSPGPSPR